MSLFPNNKELDGFGDTPRRLYLTVTELKLHRGAAGFEPEDDQLPKPAVWERITGNATVEDDSLTIIGSGETPTERLEFTLRSFKDWSSLSEYWNIHGKWQGPKDSESAESDEQTEILEYLNRVHKLRYDDRPPTASVGFFQEKWFAECEVPKNIFDALSNDFLKGRCRTIRICLDLHPTLVDNEYDEYGPVVFGFLDWETYGTSGYGWVEGISWGQSDDEILPDETKLNIDELKALGQKTQEQIHTLQQSITESTGNLASEFRNLNLTLRSGIIFIVLLIMFLELLRFIID